MRYLLFVLTLLLCLQPALAQRGGNPKIEGQVTSVDSRGGVVTLQDGGSNYVIVVQKSTRFKGFDRLGDLRGQRVSAETIRLDDGRLLATELRIRGGGGHGHDNGYDDGPNTKGGGVGQPGYAPPPQQMGIRVNGLINGQVVPPFFNVTGQTAPNSAVWVQVTPSRQLIPGVISAQLSPFRVDGRSDGAGNFNLPVQANSIPRGSRIDLQVNARDSYGNMQQPYACTVTRQ